MISMHFMQVFMLINQLRIKRKIEYKNYSNSTSIYQRKTARFSLNIQYVYIELTYEIILYT